MAGVSVLSSLSVRTLANQNLLRWMDRYNTRQLQDQQDLKAGKYQQRISSTNRTIDDWQDLRGDLEKTQRYLESLVGTVEDIQDLVDRMTTTAYSARDQDGVSSHSYKASFDSALRSLNTRADDNALTPNLLGSAEVSDYTYETDPSGATRSLSRHYLGSDYYIIDGDGKKWIREPDYQLVLKRVDADTGAATGEQADITTGLRLDSFDKDTGAVTFTIQPGTDNEAQFSGTLYKSGLQILDAWLYEGLTTESGRTSAREDLHRARSEVEVQLARYTAALSQAGFHDDRAAETVRGLSNKVDSLTLSQLLAIQETNSEREYVNGVNSRTVSNNAALRSEYFRMLSAGDKDLVRTWIDAVA